MLHGPVNEVRRRYATDTYQIEFQGTAVALANALGFSGELVHTEDRGEWTRARVRITKGADLNQVLRQLLPAVRIHGVQEEIPRMHDIFIRAVSEQEPTHVVADMTE